MLFCPRACSPLHYKGRIRPILWHTHHWLQHPSCYPHPSQPGQTFWQFAVSLEPLSCLLTHHLQENKERKMVDTPILSAMLLFRNGLNFVIPIQLTLTLTCTPTNCNPCTYFIEVKCLSWYEKMFVWKLKKMVGLKRGSLRQFVKFWIHLNRRNLIY